MNAAFPLCHLSQVPNYQYANFQAANIKNLRYHWLLPEDDILFRRSLLRPLLRNCRKTGAYASSRCYRGFDRPWLLSASSLPSPAYPQNPAEGCDFYRLPILTGLVFWNSGPHKFFPASWVRQKAERSGKRVSRAGISKREQTILRNSGF